MPKNAVTDPITDQEMAFAYLVLSGTMNDRRAAEVVGLNPDTAADTKAKPRVRAYMTAAVREKPVHQEAQGLPNLNLGRDLILTRLWELANLGPEVTRGSIAGQMKALSMIVAIEGLIPGQRLSPPATPPVEPKIDVSGWLRRQPDQAAGMEPGDAVQPAPKPEPPPKPAKAAPSPNLDRSHAGPLNPFIHHPEKLNPVPATAGCTFDTVFDTGLSLMLPILPKKGPLGRGH